MNRPFINCTNCEHAESTDLSGPCSDCVGFAHFQYRLITPPVSIHQATAIAKEHQTIKRQREQVDKDWKMLEVTLALLGLAIVISACVILAFRGAPVCS